MKNPRLFLILLLIPFILSCEKADEFKVAEPVTYYLSDQGLLRSTPGPVGAWYYIYNSIYPDGQPTSKSWSTYLDRNIVKGQFGCDLLFWAASECQVRIDIILKDGDQESVLATYDMTVPFINDSTGIQYKKDAEANPLLGTNPKDGKNDYLMLRITHISGADPVQIFNDGAIGWWGCTHITVFHDKQ